MIPTLWSKYKSHSESTCVIKKAISGRNLTSGARFQYQVIPFWTRGGISGTRTNSFSLLPCHYYSIIAVHIFVVYHRHYMDLTIYRDVKQNARTQTYTQEHMKFYTLCNKIILIFIHWRLAFFQTSYRNLVVTSQKTEPMFVIQTSPLKLLKEIICWFK